MSIIKNIIFDLGGVLLNIDYQRSVEAFKQLGLNGFEQMYSQAGADHLFEKLETGDISEEDFYATLRSYLPSLDNSMIRKAWNTMLLDFRTGSLSCLEQLSSNYKIYLLSNTNSIHLSAFREIFRVETGKNAIEDYFIRTYYSHEIGRRKPYVETYEYVCEDAGIRAGETLFVDDSIQNIEGAADAGLNTHHLLPGKTIEEIILF